MPTSASPDITSFAVLRTSQSVVSTLATSIAGWLIWTAMKIVPATAAAAPAALIRPLLVTFTVSSFVLDSCRRGMPAMSWTVGADVVRPHHQVR